MLLYSVIQAVGAVLVALGGVFIGKTNLRKLGWATLGTGIIVYVLTSAFNAYEQERKSVLLHETILELRDKLYEVSYGHPPKVKQTFKSSLKLSNGQADKKITFGADGMKTTSSIINGHLKILSPSDNGTVSHREFVQGVVSDPMAKLWLVIHPMDVSTYWVQPSITVSKDGSWKTVPYFGRAAADVGKRFEVMAIANPQKELKEADALSGWPEAQWTSKVIEVIRK